MKSAVDYIKQLLQQGRYSFSRSEIGEGLGKKDAALNLTLQRLRKAGWIAPISRGFYLALDVQHQDLGMLDPAWFVDDWAQFMQMDHYYVGGLSAAALHGAAHQRPMQFQVFADRQVRDVKQPNLLLKTFYKKTAKQTPIVKMKSTSGYFNVSTPEATAFDIVAYHRCCPSLDHVATVLVELAEVMHAKDLAELARISDWRPNLQRLGWLLDYVNWPEKAASLHAALKRQSLKPVTLETRLPAEGPYSERWQIVENTDIQPDIER
jgi:predicted transcriptional regulator of viral defense system